MDYGGKSGKRFVKFILFLKLIRIVKHASFGQNYYNNEKKIHKYWEEKGYKYTNKKKKILRGEGFQIHKYKYTNIERRRVTNTQILRGEELQIHKYEYINIERRRVTNSAGKRTIRWHDVRNIRNTPISLIHWIWVEEGVEILEKEI